MTVDLMKAGTLVYPVVKSQAVAAIIGVVQQLPSPSILLLEGTRDRQP